MATTHFRKTVEDRNLVISKLAACGMCTMNAFGRTTKVYSLAASSMICETLLKPNPTNRLSYLITSRFTTMYGSKSGAHLWR